MRVYVYIHMHIYIYICVYNIPFIYPINVVIKPSIPEAIFYLLQWDCTCSLSSMLCSAPRACSVRQARQLPEKKVLKLWLGTSDLGLLGILGFRVIGFGAVRS